MNIPNILSLIRIMLIPVTAHLFSTDRIFLATGVFIAACLTDILDGYIARHFNMITDLGKILDPLADKGMQMTVLASMAMCGLMPWVVVIFIFCKELIQCVGGFLLYRLGVVISAKASGKVSTVITSLCVMAILLLGGQMNVVLLITLQWLPVCFAVMAFLRYVFLYVNVKKTQ